MKGKQILVVEDEGNVALDIRKRLQELGYGVCGIASSGEDAVEIIYRNLVPHGGRGRLFKTIPGERFQFNPDGRD